MILFGLFKRFKVSVAFVALSGLLLAALNIFMLSFQVDSFWVASITGLLWGSGEYSYFPFLAWIFYPIMGFVFGSFLIRCNNRKKYYAMLMVLSAIVFLGGTYLFNVWAEIPNGMISDNGYYHHILTDNITFTALVILEISLLSFVAPLIPAFLQRIFERWSKNVTAIFFIHWIIITWATLYITPYSLNMPLFVLFLFCVIPASDSLAHLYSKIKSRLNHKSITKSIEN